MCRGFADAVAAAALLGKKELSFELLFNTHTHTQQWLKVYDLSRPEAFGLISSQKYLAV